jgi:GT2 family glycosyltransferase
MNLVSIIVPIRSRADLTKVCLDSIVTYTETPYELILVQEGEDEEITNLLTSYKDAKFVHNKTPKGFAGAMNSGLAVASGDYFCFLNNDTVVIPKWLSAMMEAFLQDETVGLVTPTYSEMPGRQVIDHNKGQKFDYVDDPVSLKGVCFLVSKKALDKIGKWDESFGLGGGEDNDLCVRIKMGGFKLVIARESYIYHYGSATFRDIFDNDVDYSKKYAVSQFNKFRKKYDMDKKQKPRIFITVPCANGFIHHELALRLIQWSHNENYSVSIRFYPNLAPLDNARNKAVKDFLEDYFDYFFHVDDDIVPPPNVLDVLLAADKDVIAPLCFTIKRDDEGILFPMVVAHRYDATVNGEYRPYIPETDTGGIHETDVVTGGCHLVKREVMEKLERPYYFTYHKNGTVIYSEDFVFSQQCQKLGYKLYTHYGLHCKHIKLVDVKDMNDLMSKYGK